MKTFRRTLARRIISLGIKLHGEFEPTAKPILEPKSVSKGGSVVEVTDEPIEWAPEQHGSVVIAEPDMLTRFRREKHDDSVPGM